MTEFKFLNGGDTVVKLNGEVLGGVKKAVCRKNNTINKITEFLNETPVASFAESSYVVELEMNLADIHFFDDKNTFDNIEFLNKQKNVRYFIPIFKDSSISETIALYPAICPSTLLIPCADAHLLLPSGIIAIWFGNKLSFISIVNYTLNRVVLIKQNNLLS